jgi:capsular polysaccharide biosynthesis protein
VRPPVGAPRVRDYARIALRGWVVIVVATVLSGVAAVLAGMFLTHPTYAATTQVFALVPGDAQTHAAYEGNRGAAVRIQTYQQMATSTIVTQRTIDQLGLQETPADLAERITTISEPGTMSQFAYPLSVLLDVRVTGTDPARTVEVANAVTRNLVAASEEVEWDKTQSGPALVSLGDATAAYDARVPWWKTAGIGAGMGFALSTFLLLALGARRDQLLSSDQIAFVAEDSSYAGEGVRA